MDGTADITCRITVVHNDSAVIHLTNHAADTVSTAYIAIGIAVFDGACNNTTGYTANIVACAGYIACGIAAFHTAAVINIARYAADRLSTADNACGITVFQTSAVINQACHAANIINCAANIAR